VLELDPAVVAVDRQMLGLRTGPGLQVRTGDARVGLQGQPKRAYDLVIGDAFSGLSVPWHLTTLEVVREVRKMLRPDGIYALNLIDSPPSVFARAEARTLAREFPHVAMFPPFEPTRGGNFVLIASEARLPLHKLRQLVTAVRGREEHVILGRSLRHFYRGSPLLTDDFAPADQLVTPRRGRFTKGG